MPRLMLRVFAWVGVLVSSAAQADAQIANGSFETGNFAGWTLFEGGASTSPSAGIWGNIASGSTVLNSTPVFDFFDGAAFTSTNPNLPTTYTATDGSRLAIQLQNSGQFHRMFQDILFPANASRLNWDMVYQSTSSFITNSDPTGIASGQYLAVRLRNTSDALLATLFITNPGDPLSAPMSSFSGDISAFSGSLVRLSIEMDVDSNHFGAAFDNFAVTTVPEPSSIALLCVGALGVGIFVRRRRKIRQAQCGDSGN